MSRAVRASIHRGEPLNIYPVVVCRISQNHIERWKCSSWPTLQKSSFYRNNTVCSSQKCGKANRAGFWTTWTFMDIYCNSIRSPRPSSVNVLSLMLCLSAHRIAENYRGFMDLLPWQKTFLDLFLTIQTTLFYFERFCSGPILEGWGCGTAEFLQLLCSETVPGISMWAAGQWSH